MSETSTLVSGRQAAAILAEIGIPRESARRALLAGIAGGGQRTRASWLYDERRIQALLRPPIPAADLPAALRTGAFVTSVVTGADLTAPGASRDAGGDTAVLNRDWALSPIVRVAIRIRLERGQQIPYLATIAGFVVAGARIIDFGPASDGSALTRFTLATPDGWYDDLHLRRLPVPPGSNLTVIPKGALFRHFPPLPGGKHPAPGSSAA